MALDHIHITHYIDPHCFYYKTETACMQEHEQAKFAVTFNEHCENEYGIIYDTVRHVQSGKPAQPGDLVALRSNQLQRWIRCEVEELLVDLNQTNWYYLWAIDEGFPIKSDIKYVRPLPQAFRQEPAHAKRGAIINILPGETQYNYDNDEQMLVPSTKWSTGIASTLELMLENAESISFLPRNQFLLQNETIHFGELFITTQTNITHNVAKMLREACPGQMILIQNSKFFEDIKYLQGQNKKRYVNNAGLDNHVVNNFMTHYHHKTYDPANLECMETDTKLAMKVYEWLNRNKEARIAILEQQKTDRDRMIEPPITSISSESVSNKYPGRATHESDEEDGSTITKDHFFRKCDENGGNVQAQRGKSTRLSKNIKRHQARMQQMKSSS
uniref:RNA helicase n=1 Tax=Anopheles culicifacies TaxID=139723 RepID=A0A182MRB2_9DIPT